IGIADGQRAFFKSRLNEIVQRIANWMTDDRSTSSRSADLDRLKAIDFQIKDVRQKIDRMGPKGTLALRTVSDFIAPMLSAAWISDHFPEDDRAPRRSNIWADRVQRAPLRAPEYFIEELTLGARYQFVRYRSKRTLLVILRELEQGVEAALSVIKSD